MTEPRIAPYGSWASPITSDLIVASSIGLGDILVDGGDIYWIESRPLERGRSVVVCCSRNGGPVDVTPPIPADGGDAFNVRTRVHEYGGGAYLASGGVVYFCSDADREAHAQEPGGLPVPAKETPAKPRGLQIADGVRGARTGGG